MIPVRLTLKGFLSYQQATELDFAGFDLACISGSNGAGKSTLLDAITWALFGRARKKEDDALVNSSSQTAEVSFEFLYENDRYRIQRIKTRNKTCILEFQLLNLQNEWVTLSEHSLRETEKRIEQTLRMDYDTFINTCFFLQGKADQFAQQPAGKRKEILGSILNLDIWEDYRMAASLRRRKEENETASINALLEEIENELAQEGERRARLERTSRELEQKSALRIEKEKLVESTRRQAELLKEQERLLATQRGLLEDLVSQKMQQQTLLQARSEELNLHQQILSDEKYIHDKYEQWVQLRKELEELNQRAAQFYNLDQKRMQEENIIATEKARLEESLQNLKGQEVTAKDQTGKVGLLQQQLDLVQIELKTLEEFGRDKETRTAALQENQSSLAEMTAENRQLFASMNELKARIEKLKSARAECPLCGQELTDQHRASLLAGLEMEGKNQGDQYRMNITSIQECNQTMAADKERLIDLQKSVEKKDQLIERKSSLLTQIDTFATEIEKWKNLGVPQMENVENQLKNQLFALDTRERLAGITSSLQSQGYNSQTHEQIRQNEQTARESEERMRALEKAHASAQPLKREIETIRKRLAELEEKSNQQGELINTSEKTLAQDKKNLPDLLQMETDLNAVRREENDLHLESGRAEQEVAVLENRKLKKEELHTRRQDKAQLIAQLELLERAFSRNGVPALLIEQALPEIESKANQILDQLSAGSMSLSFATQRERKNKKDEGAIQTLDILITDSSGKREYELFSGGEAFRINFAIRLALSQALARRAGAKLQTLVIDEGFGSQDSDGRQRLIETINLVMQNDGHGGEGESHSDIRKILVITHLDELKDAFPARIEVEKTARGSILQVVG